MICLHMTYVLVYSTQYMMNNTSLMDDILVCPAMVSMFVVQGGRYQWRTIHLWWGLQYLIVYNTPMAVNETSFMENKTQYIYEG